MKTRKCTRHALVEICHAHNREAMMFLGDNYIGTELYGKYFEQIGLKAVVGSVGSGATMRMIADIPHVKYTEGRFLPYFFPDVFCGGGDPVGEANVNWLQARRAMLRAICWSAGREDHLKRWFSTNPATECSYYLQQGKCAVVNNTAQPQTTTVYRGDSSTFELELVPMELKWFQL